MKENLVLQSLRGFGKGIYRDLRDSRIGVDKGEMEKIVAGAAATDSGFQP